jgi:predicted nucleic acid-binding protein
MDLRAADSAVCELAVAFGARHGLGVVDAVHLATAAHSGADVFLTNNSKDFDPERIFEIDVIFPGDLSADF